MGHGNISNSLKLILDLTNKFINTLNNMSSTSFALLVGGGVLWKFSQQITNTLGFIHNKLLDITKAINAAVIAENADSSAKEKNAIATQQNANAKLAEARATEEATAAELANTRGKDANTAANKRNTLSSVLSTGKDKAKGFASGLGAVVGKLGGVANAAGLAMMAVGILSEVFVRAANDSEKMADSLKSQAEDLQAQEEILARQEKALQQVPLLTTALRRLQEQQENVNADSEEGKKLQDEYNNTRSFLQSIIGNENTAVLENKQFTVDATNEIMSAEKERYAQKKKDIKDAQDLLRKAFQEQLNDTIKAITALDVQQNSWADLCESVAQYGNILQRVRMAFNEMMRDAHTGLKSMHEDTLASYEEMKKSGASYVMTAEGMMSIDTAIFNEKQAIERESGAVEDNENTMKETVSDVKRKVVGEGLDAIRFASGVLNAGIDGNGNFNNPLDQSNLGGSDVDENMGGSGKGKKGKSSSKSKPTYDGVTLTIPNDDNYGVSDADTSGLTNDTLMKLRVLDDAVYKKFGQHVMVTSAYRPNDTDSNHSVGVAFDLSGGIMDNPDAREWAKNFAPSIGLFTIDEYGSANPEIKRSGDNIHFSNVKPGIYGETRDYEGKWSEENSAPTITDILGSSAKAPAYVDNSVQRKVYDFLIKELGLTDKQAWAVMANIDGESSFDPTAQENPDNSESGIGLMQWSNVRRHQLEQFAAMRRTDWTDLQTQLEFMKDEFLGSESDYWEAFMNAVTKDSSPTDDVLFFAGPNGVERAGNINLGNRMKNYYEYSSHYANGMSLYDSDPSKHKAKVDTPEQRAEKEAQRISKIFSQMNKAVEAFAKAVDTKYKNALDSVQEDQKLFGENQDNMTKQLDLTSNKLADMITVQKKYEDVLTKSGAYISQKDIKGLLGMSREDFLKKSAEEEAELVASIKSESALYKPVITALNQVVKIKQAIQEQDIKYHQQELQWVETYKKRRSAIYTDLIWSEQATMKEWEISHSNDVYDDWYKNRFEQDHLEQIARTQKDYYEAMQEAIMRGDKEFKDSEGNVVHLEDNPKALEEQKQKWMEADEAAKKYAATLKNDVSKNFTDMAKNILLEGGSLRQKLKDLWKGLAEDALTLLLSGGKEGTSSPLGNLLRRWMYGRKGNKLPIQEAGFGYSAGQPDFGGYGFPMATKYRYHMPGNQMATQLAVASPSSDFASQLPNMIPSAPVSSFNGLYSWNGGIVGQNNGDLFNQMLRYNWFGKFGTNFGAGTPWGQMAWGAKAGMFAQALPWLLGLFRHHATGGEINEEELAILGENKKKEYVIPVEQNKATGMALWRKAGRDLGVLKSGSPVEPDFKNKDIATNGVTSVQTKQQAVYMSQMQQQNQTLLHILQALTESPQGNGGQAIAQPVVVQDKMDINEFADMFNRMARYRYNQ